MSDYHIAKHVMGELTLGEYWNLIGCDADVAIVKNSYGKKKILGFEADDDHIRFEVEDGHKFGWNLDVPLKSKVKVDGNSVRTTDDLGKEVTIEFYELKPVRSLMP